MYLTTLQLVKIVKEQVWHLLKKTGARPAMERKQLRRRKSYNTSLKKVLLITRHTISKMSLIITQ
jgi:hypothetical protein